jgi:beta-glucosidase
MSLSLSAILVTGVLVAVASPSAHSASCPWVGSTATPDQRADMVIAQMSLDDEIALVHGNGGAYVGVVPANPALCIPALNLQDGPAGIGDGLKGVTQLPAPVAGAASWDPSLMRQYGTVIGAEAKGKGVSLALAPTINIVRDPRWGRAFESFGEDPYLTGSLAVADIGGIQSQGVMAQVKHLALYNQETNRNTTQDNVIVDARTEAEIYEPAFSAAVNPGNVASAMCSYNMVNGAFACENNFLMNTVLKGTMGFRGFITADWSATHSTVNSANAGLDLEMPRGTYFGSALKTAVQNGSVPKSRLDDMVHRILREMFAYGFFDHAATGSPTATVTSAAHTATALTAAEKGAVLLKNNGLLPLAPSSVHSIAVIGRGGKTSPMTSGGGSSAVVAPHVVTPFSGISSRAGSGTMVRYADGSNVAAAKTLAATSNVAIVFADKYEAERTDLSDISLSSDQNNLISQVASVNPRTIVVLNTGSAVTMPWLSNVAGVFEAWYPGQEDGRAIAALLYGDVNPSGHLPVSFPTGLGQVPAHTTQQWPGSNGKVMYSEGLQVGYRWYSAQQLTPLFPFGFGLSYTKFSYHNLTVTPGSNNSATVSVQVTNTGTRTGAALPQVYVTQPAGAGEPPLSLQGFKQVSLAPGTTATVSFTLPSHAFSHYDTASNAFVITPGTYTVRVGSSASSLPLSDTLTLN